MPDFIIIGAQKCGTTSLYRYIAQHPRVDPAQRKELHFFDLEYARGKRWYEDNFRRGRLTRKLLGRITGEGTPYYLFHPLVPGRVYGMYPRVKLIALLRDPVERAYSHYRHLVRDGVEDLSFEDAVAAEQGRLALDTDEGGAMYNHQMFSYLSRGLYLRQILRWREYFPKEQMLVLLFEDLRDKPSEVMEEVFGFLGLKYHAVKFKVHHSGGEHGGMEPGTRERLAEYFRPHNLELAEYLGRPLPWPGL